MTDDGRTIQETRLLLIRIWTFREARHVDPTPTWRRRRGEALMAIRPRHPCNWPGCKEVVSARFCPPHRREYERNRGSAAARGYGRDHRLWRTEILGLYPYCQDPMKRHPGEVRMALVADHIVPLSRGGTWELSNGQALCVQCHNAKSAKSEARPTRQPYSTPWRKRG